MVQAAMPPPAPRPMSAPRTMMAMDTAAPAMAMAESSMAPMKEAMKRRSRADDDESDMPMDPEPQMDEGFGGMAAESAAPDELQTNGASALPDDYAELTVRSASAAARGKLRRQEAAHGPMADEVARQLRMAQDLDDSSAVAAAFEATSRDAWFDHRYDGESTVFVPCDGQVHTVTIVTRRAAIALEHILVPRVSSEAIRQARFSNPLDRPLLGGPCDVYVGDEFLVTSSLPTANAGEFLNLGLGVDEALKVARHAFFAEEKEGLLKGSLQLTHRIETKIASRLDVETTLEVREAIPIAGSEKDAPTIEVGRVEPEWTSLDTEMTKQGHYLWRFVLKPGEEKTLHHAYRIKIDGNEELVGGNRREAT